MRRSLSIVTAAVAVVASALLAGCQTTGGIAAVSPNAQTASNPDKGRKHYYWPVELWNGFVTPPGPSGPAPTDFEIVFAGNVTADIPNPEPAYGVYDPFCPPSQTCDASVSYSASSDTTTVEFAGSQLYQNVQGHGNEVHFGLLNGPGGKRVKCFKWYTEWTFASSPPQITPVINVCNPKKVRAKGAARVAPVFATVYVETSFNPITASDPAPSGMWIDVPYTPYNGSGQKQPKFKFTNPTPQTIYTANAGIVLDQQYPTDPYCVKSLYCSENIANLELLNYVGMPPPGYPSSPFVKMLFPPPAQIPPSTR